jgi:hypothetical protein
MNSLTEQQTTLINQLAELCYWTQLKVGPHMGEKFYQHILIANLKACGYKNVVYEDLFTYGFTDMYGNPTRVGHGMNARTDIELPDMNVLLELKASTKGTKQENFAQCRNYLIHRPDVNVGVVINFISKETEKSKPYTQIDVMIKTGHVIDIPLFGSHGLSTNTHHIPEFHDLPTIYTELQPTISSYVIKEKSNPPPGKEEKKAKKVKSEEEKAAKKKEAEEAKAAKKKEVEEAKAAKKKEVEEAKAAKKIKAEEAKAAKKIKAEEAKAAKKKKVEENKPTPLLLTTEKKEFIEKYDELDDNLYYVEGGYSSVYSGMLYKTLEEYKNECKERKHFSQIKGYE